MPESTPSRHPDSTPHPTSGSGRPGPIYDRAMRLLVERDLIGTCQVLGLDPRGAPEVLPATFPAQTFTADLLIRLDQQLLAHVEYVHTPTADLVPRLLQYRGTIMRKYPAEKLSQHVIVMGKGSVRGHEDLAGEGFRLRLGLLYVRDCEPATLLERPGLAPLATLARDGQHTREESLHAALTVIHAHGGPREAELLEMALVLATIHLSRTTIRKILKEAAVPMDNLIADLVRETPPAQALLRQGREEGREEGRIDLLTALLVTRFGDVPEASGVAARLLARLDDSAAAIAITQAGSLDELDHG